MHEVLAGNLAFLEAVMNYILRTFADPAASFPLIRDLFSKGSLFSFPVAVLKQYFEDGLRGPMLHTPRTVAQDSGVAHYELWKRVTILLPNGMNRLTTQVEFFPVPELRLVAPPDAVEGETKQLLA